MIHYERVCLFYALAVPLWILYQYFEWRRKGER
jgi:hypothetical protein